MHSTPFAIVLSAANWALSLNVAAPVVRVYESHDSRKTKGRIFGGWCQKLRGVFCYRNRERERKSDAKTPLQRKHHCAELERIGCQRCLHTHTHTRAVCRLRDESKGVFAVVTVLKYGISH
jgi:hypothetical protein